MSENSKANSKYSYSTKNLHISESMNAFQKARANSSHDPTHDRVDAMCDKLSLLNFAQFVKDIITSLEYLLKSDGFTNPKLKSFSSKEFIPIDEKKAYLSYEFISEKYTDISNNKVDISFDFHRPNNDSYFIATAQSRCYPQEYQTSNSLILKTNSYELKDKDNINHFLSECVALLKIPACPNFKKYINLCNYLQDKVFFSETMIIGNSHYFVCLLLDYLQTHILNFKSNIKNPNHTKLHSNKKNLENFQEALKEKYDDLLNSYIEEFRYRPEDDPVADPEPYQYVNLMFIQGILKDNGLYFDNIPDFLNNFKKQEHFNLSVFKRFDFLKTEYKSEINESMDAWRKHAIKHSDESLPDVIGKNIVVNQIFTNLFRKYCPELLNQETQDLNNPANCVMLIEGFLSKTISKNLTKSLELQTIETIDTKDYSSKFCNINDLNVLYKKMNDDTEYHIYLNNIAEGDKKFNEQYSAASKWIFESYSAIELNYRKQRISCIMIRTTFTLNKDENAFNNSSFKFPIQSWKNPSEVISMLKWILSVRKKLLSIEFKALLSTIEKINAYYVKERYQHTNGIPELPFYIEKIFKYFEDCLFSDLGSCNLKKEYRNKEYVFNHNRFRHNRFSKEESSRQYDNLIKLYNTELEKLKSGNMFNESEINESMDAWRKHAMKHSDEPLPNVMGNNIVANQVFINLFTKYCPEIFNQETQDLNNPANCVMLIEGFLSKTISKNLIKSLKLEIIDMKTYSNKFVDIPDLDVLYKKTDGIGYHIYLIFFKIAEGDKKFNEQYSATSKWIFSYSGIELEYRKQRISCIRIRTTFRLNKEHDVYIDSSFEFPIQSWKNPSEVISILKWILSVRKRLLGDEYKALLSTIEKINAYDIKFQKEHDHHPTYGTNREKLPTYYSKMFKYFEDKLFSDLGSCILKKENRTKDYIYNQSRLSGYTQKQTSDQYDNLVKLYNTELEKLKSGNMFNESVSESMDAKRKYKIQKPVEFKNTGITIANNLILTNLFTKYCPELLNQETQNLNNPANCAMLVQGFLQKAISKEVHFEKARILNMKNFVSMPCSTQEIDELYGKSADDPLQYEIYYYIDGDEKLENHYMNISWKRMFLAISFGFHQQKISYIKICINFKLDDDNTKCTSFKFDFPMYSWKDPAEIISMLKWIISVRKKLMGIEFKALLETAKRIDEYYTKFLKHKSGNLYDKVKLPLYSSDIFRYFEDELFSDLGSCNNLHGNYQKYKKDFNNHTGIFYYAPNRKQYKNLVELYNKELEKIKAGQDNSIVNESMDALQKHAVQKPRKSENAGKIIADKLLLSNLIMTYCHELKNKENKSFNNFENCFMLFQAFLKKSISEKIEMDFNNCEIDFCKTNAEYDVKDVNTWCGPLQDIQEFINKMIDDDNQYELISYIINDEKLKNAYLPTWVLNNITIIFGFINKKINYINIGFKYKNGTWTTAYPIFGFRVNSIDDFSEIIFILKWLLNIHQKVLSDNFKAFLNTALFVNDYEKVKVYGKDLPCAVDSEVFYYFQNTIFSNGGVNLDLESTKNDIYLLRETTEYHNLVELYNKELEKLKTGTVNESMDAWRKHAMKHSDEPLKNTISDNLVYVPLAMKLCRKYNEGDEFDFTNLDFNRFEKNTYPFPDKKTKQEGEDFFTNLDRIIYNIITDILGVVMPDYLNSQYYNISDINIHRNIFFLLSSFSESSPEFSVKSQAKWNFYKNIFSDYIVFPMEFKLRLSYSNNSSSQIYMSISRNTYKLKELYDNTEDAGNLGMYNCDCFNLKLTDIINNHISNKGFCEFIKNLIESFKYFTSTGFINLMEIMKSLVWLSFFTGISPEGEKVMFLTDIHMKDRDHRNSYRKYREMRVQGWKFSNMIKMIDIISVNNYQNYIYDLQSIPFFALNDNLVDQIPDATKKFLDTHLRSDPMMRFIESVLAENNLTNKDGHICTNIKEFLDSTNEMMLYGYTYKYELSIEKLWNEEKNIISPEYQNINRFNTTDFIKYRVLKK